ITSIEGEHLDKLGPGLADVAAHKAGILKPCVPCIVGPQDDAAMAVIERRAAQIGAPLLVHGQHWHVSVERDRLIYQDETGLLDLPLPNLPGPHQIQNAGAALATLRYLGRGDSDAAVTQAFWPARMQRLTKGALVQDLDLPEVWLDGGHNPAAGRAIADTLATQRGRDTHIVCGMINTKDVAGFLAPIAPHCTSLTAITIPDEPNAVPAQDIVLAAKSCGINAMVGTSVDSALKNFAQVYPQARVLICGSLYLAGHVLRENALSDD
ncbi:MAG: bifunctional folylpolyglutamate synthase/dihydrofolate synthase, partial [Planktomarina sp.]